MNPQPIVLINSFEVPEGEDEAFLEGWERAGVPQCPGRVSLDAPAPEPVAECGLPLCQRRVLRVGAGVPGRDLPARVHERAHPLPVPRLGVRGRARRRALSGAQQRKAQRVARLVAAHVLWPRYTGRVAGLLDTAAASPSPRSP